VGEESKDEWVEEIEPVTDTVVFPDLDYGDCGFGYEDEFDVWTQPVTQPENQIRHRAPQHSRLPNESVDVIAHAEPRAPVHWIAYRDAASEGLVMPGYSDTLPQFERSMDWGDDQRCFETPLGEQFLSEADAYLLYRDIAEQTTGVSVNDQDGSRTIIGIRGAWPGSFAWHGNAPDRFNDTLVVLWIEDGKRRVAEFPVNTGTGSYDFGYHASSSLRPNRRYRYENGWHRDYNAMSIDEWAYRVRDDTNHNGHWDSDRNGWLSGGEADHERTGSGHNIHAASVDAPLGQARVQNWSAGCQTIPGMDNWTRFIDVAWEESGVGVDYFLVDARDIPWWVWQSCVPDGSHECPYEIDAFPFVHESDTTEALARDFDVYNCSEANESGPEIVYSFTVDADVQISVTVDCPEGVDVDIHLLDGDDANACVDRGHIAIDTDLGPGRYFVVVDTWVDDGVEYSGAYTLQVNAE